MREDEKQLKRLAEGSCRFNDSVQCEAAWRRRCGDCGWNPTVDRERKKRRRQRDE